MNINSAYVIGGRLKQRLWAIYIQNTRKEHPKYCKVYPNVCKLWARSTKLEKTNQGIAALKFSSPFEGICDILMKEIWKVTQHLSFNQGRPYSQFKITLENTQNSPNKFLSDLV